MWLLLTVPWVGLRFVIVVFPDHTHLLFVKKKTLGATPKNKESVGSQILFHANDHKWVNFQHTS